MSQSNPKAGSSCLLLIEGLGEELERYIHTRQKRVHGTVKIPWSQVRLNIAEGICAHLTIECMPPAHRKAAPVPARMNRNNLAQLLWLACVRDT